MRRAAIAALLTAWFLVVTAGAEAKEPPAGFQLCGSNGCATIGMDDGEPLAISLFFGGGSVELWTPAATPAPFYSLRWSYQQVQLHTAYFVPDLNLVRFVGDSASATVNPRGAIHWLRLDSRARAILDRIAATLQPTPVPSPSTVMVGGKAVQDPASYLRLWSVGKPTYIWPRGGPHDQGHLRRREPVDRRVRASQHRAPPPIPVAGLDDSADPGEARTAGPRARLAPLAARS